MVTVMRAESRIYKVKPAKLARVAISLNTEASLRDLYQWCCGFPSHARIHSITVVDGELVIAVSLGSKDGRHRLVSASGTD